ncbi:ATP-binding protein [Helicobacter cynogastricus]|uniref:ATP-binding protein n=1 Tax=Helicobacter cynogastricus TaxID=329937 RepID=UPI000CF08FF4|nr:ATP-binding protein [Helicobacter cynogastricus]
MWDVILEEGFANAITTHGIFPRFHIANASKICLYGSAKVGKSACALGIAHTFKHPVYIDGTDVRLDFNALKDALIKLHVEGRMDILIAKHCPKDIFLPPLEHIILISYTPSAPKDFIGKSIWPLRFQEFALLQKKEPSNTLLARFLKEGNLPETLFMHPIQKIRRKQEIYALFLGNQLPILKALLRFQSLSVTTHHLYTQLKKTLKISKDKLYEIMQFLQASQSIFYIPPLESSLISPKRLYFCDFALPYAFSHTHPLPPVFENMVALELRHHFSQLFYADSCLIGRSATETFCFFPWAFPANLEARLDHFLKYCTFQITHIYIITINFEGSGIINTRAYNAYSFTTFVLEILPTLGVN